jgi:hypothetical protein
LNGGCHSLRMRIKLNTAKVFGINQHQQLKAAMEVVKIVRDVVTPS